MSKVNDPDDLELVDPQPSGRQEPYAPMGGRPAPLQDLHPHARCPECGYSLYGLPHLRCPECGYRPSREELLSSQSRAALLRAARRRRGVTIVGSLMLIVGVGLTLASGATRSSLVMVGFTGPLAMLSILIALVQRLSGEAGHWLLFLMGAVWLAHGAFLWWVL